MKVQLSCEHATCTKIVVHALMAAICCSTQAPFYKLTDQSGRSTEIGRIVEVILEEVRQHMHVCKKCQCQLLHVCTRYAEATRGTLYQTEENGAGKLVHPVQSHTRCSVSITVYTTQAWPPCLFADVAVDAIIIVNNL